MRKDITGRARVLYGAAFNGEDLPRGWKVYFVDRCRWSSGVINHRRAGQCSWLTKRIEVVPALQRPSTWSKHWLRTLIHEFVHQRCRGLRHGREFDRLVDAALERLWATS